MENSLISLSDQSTAIILGSLLGDGSLKIHRPYKNARFSFRHTIHQKEYFFWKVDRLKEISGKQFCWLQGVDKPDGWGSQKWRYQSIALPSLTELHFQTHLNNSKKIERVWLNKLTPLSLAIWWCDDGSLIGDTRQGVFCTNGFSLEEVQILNQYLKEVWYITTSIIKVKNYEQYMLRLNSTVELQKFLRIIIPYIPVEQMLPKVIMMYRDREIQQRWISEIVLLGQFPWETVKQYLVWKRAKWKQFRDLSENDIVQPL